MTLQMMLQVTNRLSHEKPIIQIPSSIIEHLNIPKEEKILVRVGKKSIISNLSIISGEEYNEPAILMNHHLFQELALPPIDFRIQTMYKNHELCFGPVIAVLTEIKIDDDHSSFGSIHDFCSELAQYCQQVGGIIYITALSHIHHHGYYFIDGTWIKERIPFPDFIYNRIHSRRTEYSKIFKQVCSDFQKNKCCLFNSRFYSKWEVHQLLAEASQLNTFLPKTAFYNKKTLFKWLQDSPDLFIKPIHGSLGRHMIHVFHNEKQITVEQSILSSNPSKFEFRAINEAITYIDKWIKKRKFLIQETIPLITYEERKIDFRLLSHKKNSIDWEITSAVARLSDVHQFVSNIAQGGTLSKPMKILPLFFPKEKAILVYQLMKDLALEVSKILEKSSQESIVELGIDIGVDINGQPWLIEVNSKPSKKTYSITDHIRPSAKSIINYCNAIWKERSDNDGETRDFNINTR